MNKKKEKFFKNALVVSIFVFGILFILGLSILSVVAKFDIAIPYPNLIFTLFIVGILLISYPTACLLVSLYKNKSIVYISIHAPSLFILCFLIAALLFSLDNEVFIKIEAARLLINLEWGIFGTTIAILAIWVIFIVQKIDSSKYQKISDVEFTYFLSLDLITIGANLLILILATSLTYLYKEEKITPTSQTFVLFSFFLSIYTVLTALIQMFIPLVQKRSSIKNKHDEKKSKKNANKSTRCM